MCASGLLVATDLAGGPAVHPCGQRVVTAWHLFSARLCHLSQQRMLTPGRMRPVGAPDAQGTDLFVMIDSACRCRWPTLSSKAFGQPLDQLAQSAPSSQLIGYGPQADSAFGVAVLRMGLS
jgi:hypothetical protein